MTRGERNNNPGNIRRSPIAWKGEVPGTDADFETFDTPENGIRALGKLLRHYIAEGFNTPRKIIQRYAPSIENDTDAYLAAVCKATSITADTTLSEDAETVSRLVHAIINHENGRVIYSDITIARGIEAAFA